MTKLTHHIENFLHNIENCGNMNIEIGQLFIKVSNWQKFATMKMQLIMKADICPVWQWALGKDKIYF